ncbi:triple tyrosine motif-containing protein [Cryomorphaceae bacterium 1068]|nr:triple tyrosine motif-containing protein [Cryomorphaceae bacterium 1068]
MQTPLISNYGKEVHRGGTQNWSITAHKDGVIYFGNNSGVLVFDGHEWTVVPLPNRTFVRSLLQKDSGQLYVGGQNEFGYFSNGRLSVENYHSLKHLVPEEYADFEDVWEIFDTGESTYFCTEKAVFIISNGNCEVLLPKDERFENFFLFDNQLCVQEIGTGLLLFDGNKLVPFLSDPIIVGQRIASMLSISDGDHLLFTQEGAIFRFDGSVLEPFGGEAENFTKEFKQYVSIRLKNGSIAIGSTQNGLIIINESGEVLEHYNSDSGLANNTLLSLYQDRSENIWMGLDNGIAYLEINSPFSQINQINGLEGTGYAALLHKESYYFGTNLGLYRAKSGEDNFELVDNTKGQIWSLQTLHDGFIINADGGALYFENDVITRISDVRSSWKFYELAGSDGLFLQGSYGGLYLYQKSDRDAVPLKFLGKLDGFDESSRIFEEDEDGYIWVAHAYRGLFRLKPDYKNLRFEEVRQFGVAEGLPEDLYITVSKIRNEMVFATMKGIFRFDRSTEKFEVHEELTTLLGKERSVQRLVEDKLGNIWFSTDREFGLVEILETGLYNDVEVLYFNQIQDELVDGFEDVFTLSDAAAFIPVESGFYKYKLRWSAQPPEFEYPLRITEIYLTSTSDSLISDYYSSDTIAETKLPPKEGDIRFHFNLPTFGKLNQVVYQYTLSDEDNGWSDWTTETKKEYSNLTHGDYTFQVRAKNAFGRISEPVSFGFSVMPPWYKTTAAQVGFVVLGFLVLLTVVRFVAIREAKKTEEVKQQSILTIREKEEEHQREKEQSENEIIRLRNEKLRAEVSHKNAELASTTMHLVQKSEMLQNIKKDLSDLSTDGDESVKKRVKQIQRLITDDVRLDKNWERFETHFDQVHANFFKNLRAKYPELTPKDQKLCAYLRMNLATKEIAPLLNISVRGVEISRYRLRKKLNLDSDTNLVSFIMEI